MDAGTQIEWQRETQETGVDDAEEPQEPATGKDQRRRQCHITSNRCGRSERRAIQPVCERPDFWDWHFSSE